ncbi:MAG: hypothetical protein KC493_13005 [Bacteriovoracaceae bacterium]|nr:hypothetical protein [Bacteriovoracaceae bacterium]
MKALLTVFFITLSIASGFSGEVTGAGMVKNILKKKHMNLERFLSTGHELKLGEVTGAGRQIELDRVKVVVTNSEAFKLENVQRIEFQKSGGLKLGNVDFFEINNKVIEVKNIKAMIIKKKK